MNALTHGIIDMDIKMWQLQEKWRNIVKGKIHSRFPLNPSKDERRRISSQWPLQLDMVTPNMVARDIK